MNKQIKKVIIISFFVIGLAILYFQFLLPSLNFIYNKIPDKGGDSSINIESGDDIVDRTRPANPTPEATPTPSNAGTPRPGETVSPTPETTPGKGVISEVKESYYVELKPGTKNLLLLGTDLFAFDEDYYGLADTMVVLNIDQASKVIKIVSLPRDAFVPYSDNIAKVLVQNGYLTNPGAFKLNMVPWVGRSIVKYTGGKFEESGISFLCAMIEAMLGSSNSNYAIDDYMLLNFTGFMELIDEVGGVWVDVCEDIYDMHGNLLIKEGWQMLDSTKALQYARTRYRYDPEVGGISSTGDFFRKTNQLNMLIDISTQILSPKTLANFKGVLDKLTENVFHSLNSVSKIAEYVDIAYEYLTGVYSIEAYVISGMQDGELDPFGDHASYCNITVMTPSEIDAIVSRWRNFL